MNPGSPSREKLDQTAGVFGAEPDQLRLFFMNKAEIDALKVLKSTADRCAINHHLTVRERFPEFFTPQYEATQAQEAKAKQNRETAQWILDVATWWKNLGGVIVGAFLVWMIFFGYPGKAPDFHVVANEQQHIWRVYNNDWLIEAFPSLQEAEEARDKYEQEAEDEARAAADDRDY